MLFDREGIGSLIFFYNSTDTAHPDAVALFDGDRDAVVEQDIIFTGVYKLKKEISVLFINIRLDRGGQSLFLSFLAGMQGIF